MDILITGASGMIGGKLAAHLAREGALGDKPIDRITLFDVVPPRDGPPVSSAKVEVVTGNLADPALVRRLIAPRPDIIFHIAAVVSGEAEADFDKGYAVNMDASRALLEAVRGEGPQYRPRFVFASSSGVYGAPFPAEISDEFHLTPLTSYGTQKAIVELLLNDYSRRGIVEGVGLRLPTIVVRPGAPNRAASGFFSNIIREPLVGREAILPVDDDVRHYVASPRSAVGFFLHAAAMDTAGLGANRSLPMPGLATTVADMLEGLRRVAGDRVLTLIRREPDPLIRKMVSGWPRAIEARRARALGFVAESNFADIVTAHIADELGGRIGG